MVNNIPAFIIMLLFLAAFQVRAEEKQNTAPADSAERKVLLIVSEKSPFKRALVSKVQDLVESVQVDVKNVEIKVLPKEMVDHYTATLILSPIHSRDLQKEVKDFLEKASPEQKRKIILVTTAGDRSWKQPVEGVNAITSASAVRETDTIFNYIGNMLYQLLIAE